ncbi:acyl carrier protein phosphodiesterase [Flavilitoribacter nigricans]|uniref:ACP phosphodiesterase n=1 Tax=Flavilitoribacter nigricans (strain ATCC 23147 / DSM 23189 / NBRC 102662 / NCIMB 1420 / SS-2) TaxID=1122177 RepID=A0A2D0N9Q2_FLAN2|nr:ACP phosphodiesterase [Flavilitoribacter nigricans]PHN05254.1 ACP phosphodiesterase [Flavilitoribacter nigricans DSM 23189 = NBRC 102662]
MNFLAHMLLSCESDTLVTGNFLGDLLRNSEIAALPEPVQIGVQLHRKIDMFTDSHPRVKQSSRLLYDRHGKYAPVLVDVYYDFFLSRHWSRFHPESLEEFSEKIYQQLLAFLDVMPERTQRQLKAMIEDDWLMNYATYDGMETTIRRMSRRVSKPVQLQGAVESLKLFEPRLEADFLAFFPEIMEYVRRECAC